MYNLNQHGALQTHSNWTNFLSLADKKADLVHFLSEELCSQAPEIVVAGGFRDELEEKFSKAITELSHLHESQS